MRKLIRLQWLKFKRSTSKMEVFGRVYLFFCVWLVEIIGIFEADLSALRSLGGWPRILVLVAICVALGIFDVVYKLIFKHNATVMDAFLKTKPIPAAVWEKYLMVSQLWHPDNLMMPLIVMPLCFAIFHFGWGLVAILVLYLLSVAGGVFLMEIRRGSDYEEEKKSSEKRVRKSFGHGSVFGLQVLSLLRSKRLRTSMIYLVTFFTLYVFIQPEEMSGYMIFMVMLCAPMIFGQYGFGMEANHFNAIWTKPLAIKRVLIDKYYFLGELTVCVSIILAVVCLIRHIPFLTLLGSFLFVAGFANLLILLDACNATRFDLNGKAFFNYQGSASTFRPVMFLIILVSMALGGIPIAVFDGWVQLAVLGGMGLLGFALHRPALGWVEKRFLEKRYRYMDKYTQQ